MTGEQTAKKAGDSARLAEETGTTGLLIGSSNDVIEKKDSAANLSDLEKLNRFKGRTLGEDNPTTQPSASLSGAKIYAEKCSSCHGVDGNGVQAHQWSLRQGPAVNKSSATMEEILKIIRDGRANRGMPAWGSVLSEKELAAVSKFVFDFEAIPKNP